MIPGRKQVVQGVIQKFQRSMLGISVKLIFGCSTLIGGRKGLTMVDGLLAQTLDKSLLRFMLSWIKSMARGMIYHILGFFVWFMG